MHMAEHDSGNRIPLGPPRLTHTTNSGFENYFKTTSLSEIAFNITTNKIFLSWKERE